MAVTVRDLYQAVPHRPDVLLREDEDRVVPPEYPHHVQGETGRVVPRQHGASLYQLGLHQGKVLQKLDAPVEQALQLGSL